MKSFTGNIETPFDDSGNIQFSVPSLAAFLDVDPSTVRRWIYAGKLQVARMGGIWLILINEHDPPDCIKKYLPI